ncbi:MAG: hypothetical protein RID53_08600 [Coleofasciculus sp. B1-GNL1-01]|uniref:hypothetical protein n=1 Tax=Coleofasciculus sp. B1-GNL1-01 TaxID=3068484 RepID=UPI003300C2C3
MDFDPITRLLSNHRKPGNPTIPTTLTKQQLVSLLRSRLSPNQSSEGLTQKIQEELRELQAQGEVLAGSRNRYSMAPPTVLALARDNVNGLLFRGDRAYLALAHQALKTEQREDELRIRPKVHGFNRIRNRLQQVGIRLLTVADSIEQLPLPRPPSPAVLRSPWFVNPFTDGGMICHYVPQPDRSQKERWLPASYQKLSDQTLLQLPTGDYLWFADRAFYELEPDVAILAMFYQDREAGCPLKIQWDEPQGRLNLAGVILPGTYARWLWCLSEPDTQRYRTRSFQSTNYPLVKKAFERLGCILV